MKTRQMGRRSKLNDSDARDEEASLGIPALVQKVQNEEENRLMNINGSKTTTLSGSTPAAVMGKETRGKHKKHLKWKYGDNYMRRKWGVEKNVDVKMQFEKIIRTKMKEELKQIRETRKNAKFSSTSVTVTMPSPEYLIKELQKKTSVKLCSSASLQSMPPVVSAAESSLYFEEGIGFPTMDSSIRNREGDANFTHSRLEQEKNFKATEEFGCIEVGSIDARSSGTELTVAVSTSDDPVSLSDSELADLADAGEIPAQEKSSAGLPPPPTMRLAANSADHPDRTNSECDDMYHAKMIETLGRLGTLVSIQSKTEPINNDDKCSLNVDNMNNEDGPTIEQDSNIEMIETRSSSLEPNVNNDDADAPLQDVNPVPLGSNETFVDSSPNPSFIDDGEETGPASEGINDQSSTEFFTNRISSISSALSYPRGSVTAIPGLDVSASSQCSHVKMENEENMEDMDIKNFEDKGTASKEDGDASKDTLVSKGEMNTPSGRVESSPPLSAVEAGSNETKPKEIFCNHCQKNFNHPHFHCKVCNIICNGVKNLQQHKLGKPHAAMVKFVAAQKRGNRRSVFNDDLRIELDRRRLQESRSKGKVYYFVTIFL